MSDLKLQTQIRHSQEGVQKRSVRHADQLLQLYRGASDCEGLQTGHITCKTSKKLKKKVTINLLHRIKYESASLIS